MALLMPVSLLHSPAEGPTFVGRPQIDAVATDGELVRLMEVTEAGFSIEAPTAFAIGTLHAFQFERQDEAAIVVQARALRSYVMDGDHASRVITEFGFLRPANARMNAVLERVRLALSFD